jgi:hypothetical protein
VAACHQPFAGARRWKKSSCGGRPPVHQLDGGARSVPSA